MIGGRAPSDAMGKAPLHYPAKIDDDDDQPASNTIYTAAFQHLTEQAYRFSYTTTFIPAMP